MTIDASSIGIKFENFMQAGCKDQGLRRGRTVYCQKPIILPKTGILFWNIFRIANIPYIICGVVTNLITSDFEMKSQSKILIKEKVPPKTTSNPDSDLVFFFYWDFTLQFAVQNPK